MTLRGAPFVLVPASYAENIVPPDIKDQQGTGKLLASSRRFG